jgi:putative tryptophan/tyrosine transport system substrate-binding protein
VLILPQEKTKNTNRKNYWLLIWTVLSVIGLIVGVLFSFWYQASQTKESENLFTVGIASWNSDAFQENIVGFKKGLAEKGYKEGENIQFIIQSAAGDKAKQQEIIESFVKQDVDLIYTLTTPGTLIAKEITKEIPIVFGIVTYPVEVGLIDSLASSGNNLVGARNYVPLNRQFFQFERLYPDISSLAFVHRKGEPNSEIQLQEMKDLAKNKNFSVFDIAAVDAIDIAQLLEEKKEELDATFAACDTLIQIEEQVIIDFNAQQGIPGFSCLKSGVEAGSLMGTVADSQEVGRMSGVKAGLILSGAFPTSLVTESPFNIDLIINQNTAEQLEIEIPAGMKLESSELINE